MGFVFNLEMSPLCKTFQHLKNYPHFWFAGDTSRTEDKFSLHFIMHFTQLHCGTVMNITWQLCIVL